MDRSFPLHYFGYIINSLSGKMKTSMIFYEYQGDIYGIYIASVLLTREAVSTAFAESLNWCVLASVVQQILSWFLNVN